MHASQRFEQLLDSYRQRDGSRWTGQQIDEATDGVVPRSYVTNFSKGRIKSLGRDKMAAIAKAMGFPPEAWFDESIGEGASFVSDDGGHGIARRIEHPFDAIRVTSISTPR